MGVQQTSTWAGAWLECVFPLGLFIFTLHKHAKGKTKQNGLETL
jgi:hypothetical protein